MCSKKIKDVLNGIWGLIGAIGEALDLVASSSIKITFIVLAFILLRVLFGMDAKEANNLLLNLLQLTAIWASLAISVAIILGAFIFLESVEKARKAIIILTGILTVVSFISMGWFSSKSIGGKVLVFIFIAWLAAVGYVGQRKRHIRE